jgi:hypothetical protein
MLAFLLLLALPLRAAPPELPAWAAQYGLSVKEGAWVYARKRPGLSYEVVERPLTEAEALTLSRSFAGLSAREAAALVEKKEREALAKTDLTPERCLWFEPGPDGALKLSELGKNAGPGVLLGDAFGDHAHAPAAQPPSGGPRLDPEKALAALGGLDALSNDPSAHFDGSGRDRAAIPFYAGWGLAPNSIQRGRNIEAAYGLYSVGSNRAMNALLGEREKGPGGVAARFAKAFTLDIPIGLIGSFWQHELGHFDYALMAGAKDVAWTHDGESNFMGILGTTTMDGEGLTPAQLLAFNNGGIVSTQASAEDMKRRFLAGEKVDWWRLPLWAFEKMDATVYGFITPRQGGSESWDTVQWANAYSARRPTSAALAHDQLLAGAVWNMLDPTFFWASAAYFADYVVGGRERLENPMLRAGDVRVMPGTGFWPSELGPQYRASVLARHAPTTAGGELAVTAGDGGQLTTELGVDAALPGQAGRARVGGALWAQRARAQPGPLLLGGALGAGLDIAATRALTLVVDGGAKTRGALLGRRLEAGPWLEGGVQGSF